REELFRRFEPPHRDRLRTRSERSSHEGGRVARLIRRCSATVERKSMDNGGKIVEQMLNAWQAGAVNEIAGYFTEDAVRHPMPMSPLVGREAICDGMKRIFAQVKVVRFETLHQLEHGELVMNERVDRFVIDGKNVDLPVVGVFELRGGAI